MRKVLKGGTVYRDGKFIDADVSIVGERIETVAPGIFPREEDEVFDVRGCRVIPGLVDVHVHLREPGFPAKETIRTGTEAAAHGGFTTVCAMPNLDPAPDSPESLGVELEKIHREAVVKVLPYGCITRGQKGYGELVDFEALCASVVGFSDDGRGVQDAALMEEAMRRAARCGKPIVAHCEENELLRGGYIHDGVYAREHGHRGICSESEWRQVARDVELAARTGCRYHVCHVSTKESVEIIRKAKAAGIGVTCETAPHYLILCDEDLQEDGRFKMNPPIRSRADREALIAGVVDGTIDVIATDHAPHTAAEKSRGLAGSAMGIVGLETAVPIIYTGLVMKGFIPEERMVELMSAAPRCLFGIGGALQSGESADVTVLDFNRKYVIDPDTFRSKGRSTPFAGMQVQGCSVLTLVNGRTVYAAEEFDDKLKRMI